MTGRERVFFALLLGLVVAIDPLTIDVALPAAHAMASGLGTDFASIQLSLSLFVLGMAAASSSTAPCPTGTGATRYSCPRCCSTSPPRSRWPSRQESKCSSSSGWCKASRPRPPRLSRAVVRDRFDRENASRVLSYMFLVHGLMPVVALIAGGWLTGAAGWRSAFQSGAPAALIVHLGQTPETFGWFFAFTMVGNLIGNPIGSRLLIWSTLVALASGIAVIAPAFAGATSPRAIALPVFLNMFAFALILPPAIAGALSPFLRIAGAASSLVGVVQLGSGALAGAVIAGFDDGTQMPLVIGMAVPTVAGLIAFAFVRRLTADNPASDIAR